MGGLDVVRGGLGVEVVWAGVGEVCDGVRVV